MRRTAALTGLVGLVLIVFGLLAVLFTSGGFARFFSFINIAGGIIALIGWLVSSWGNLGTLAGSRRTRYGTNAAVYTVAFIGLLIAVNYLAARYNHKFDMSVERVFSLSPQSVKVLKELKKPIKLYGFVQAGSGGQYQFADTLYKEYRYASPLLSYELVDPNRHPELAEKYKVSVMNTTHIQYGGEKGEGTNVTDLSEQGITNGIIKLIKSGEKTVCFLQGEGEADIADTQNEHGLGEFKSSLEGENYAVKKLNLVTEPKVPDDCTALAIAGPTRPLVPHEIDAIADYLKGGGRVLAMLQPPRPDGSIDEAALVNLVGTWGVKAGDNIVVDQVVRLFAGPALGLSPTVNSYGESPITTAFDKQTVFPMVRSVDPIDSGKRGLDVTALAKTSDTSWAESDLKSLFENQTAKFDASDKKGPITVAASVEADLKQLSLGSGQARLVVFGDTDFADNQYIRNFFNRDFIMNCVDWLAGESSSITIRPRTLRASRFNLTVGEFDVVFVLSVLLLPELLLIVGIAVWWERRN
jgi:gliding motility-associatede transport system auxiliary component